jgi:uncharacterized protein (TIGR01777 family)
MIKKTRMIIAGGSGFFGNYLIDFFKKQYTVVVLTRGASTFENDVEFVHWDGKSQGNWLNCLAGAEVLINLSGKSINCKFTEENKKKLMSSRIESTKALVIGVSSLKHPPKVFLNASAGAMYALLDAPNVEGDNAFKTNFLSEMALSWEAEFFKGELPKTRRATLRISLILGRSGGVYAVLRKITKCYLGGFVGSGNQIMSWIHIEDAIKSIEFIISNESIKGPVNMSTIKPESNANFMRQLRTSLAVFFGFPAPAIGLKMASSLIDIEPSLILNSVNFIPKKLLDAGFKFKFEKLEAALKDLR